MPKKGAKGVKIDMGKYVDECFQFVADHQRDSETLRVPKGSVKHAKRMADLHSQLQQTKQNISKVQ